MSTTILTPEQIETLFREHDDLYAFGHAIAAAVLQSPEVQQWQPIETAPHEVEVLLGWREWDGKWKAEVSPASWGWTTKTVSNISRHGQATHWMPLPAPPLPGPAEP